MQPSGFKSVPTITLFSKSMTTALIASNFFSASHCADCAICARLLTSTQVDRVLSGLDSTLLSNLMFLLEMQIKVSAVTLVPTCKNAARS